MLGFSKRVRLFLKVNNRRERIGRATVRGEGVYWPPGSPVCCIMRRNSDQKALVSQIGVGVQGENG